MEVNGDGVCCKGLWIQTTPPNHSLISASQLDSGSYNEEMGPLVVSCVCVCVCFLGMKYYPWVYIYIYGLFSINHHEIRILVKPWNKDPIIRIQWKVSGRFFFRGARSCNTSYKQILKDIWQLDVNFLHFLIWAMNEGTRVSMEVSN